MNEDVLIAYCFGLLPEDERAALAQDIERHPQAAIFVRHSLDSLTALVLDLPPVRVPDYARDELIGRIREQLQAAPVHPNQPDANQPEAGKLHYNIPNIPADEPSVAPVPTTRPTAIPTAATTATTTAATNPEINTDATFIYDVTSNDVTQRRGARHPLSVVGQSIVIAGLVLAGVWWGFLRPLRQELAIGQLLAQTTSQAGATSYPLLTSAGDSLGVVVRTDNGELLFILDDPPPNGQVYHVWQRRAGDTQSLGTASERAFFVRRSTEMGSTVLVTLEPADTPSAANNPIATLTL